MATTEAQSILEKAKELHGIARAETQLKVILPLVDELQYMAGFTSVIDQAAYEAIINDLAHWLSSVEQRGWQIESELNELLNLPVSNNLDDIPF